MKIWLLIISIIALIFSYLFLPPLFALLLILVIIYTCYRLYRWFEHHVAPPGKKIRHGALRGHLEENYGVKEGGRLYKDMVRELRHRGYK